MLTMIALEPLINLGTSYQIPEGFEINIFLEYLNILKKHNVVGADIVEYNPLLDKIMSHCAM